MTIILSEKALSALQSKDLASLEPSHHVDFELTIQSPRSQSRGYKRSLNFSHGLNLLIRDYWLQDALVEELLPEPEGLTLEFGFNIAVLTEADLPSSDLPEASFVQVAPNRTQADTVEWPHQGRLLKIDLHLRAPATKADLSTEQLALIPAELQRVVRQRPDLWCQSLGAIAPNIQLVLQQILNCPYTGSIQQVYLEGKALELIALQTAQWIESGPSRPTQRLKPSDIDRIHQARDLIAQRLDAPPSLLELARAVGLNDCTLKRGFRQVFGTTVFGYLRQQRLLKAQQLLQDTEMSVAEVTCQVGYSHAGHFAAAFKREFGVSPKVFKNSVL
ncbi:helix-turn-helix transcriptional regulator [Nodosilinea sp. LEGE 06152]|uniref:helix-turn-helix transcriptional regulator n=1 Tax=Nodosilinea sp. LEGE 06152 TaxID=2777966 RepID=UPI0018828800|nr:AraC family transcriptional regulator [Nodosilinea sp. LEGE 06152]MBE9160700.1 helix-turn-helix transcriptional regulator [Nodosilinea sp. LEGE 06152]